MNDIAGGVVYKISILRLIVASYILWMGWRQVRKLKLTKISLSEAETRINNQTINAKSYTLETLQFAGFTTGLNEILSKFSCLPITKSFTVLFQWKKVF